MSQAIYVVWNGTSHVIHDITPCACNSLYCHPLNIVRDKYGPLSTSIPWLAPAQGAPKTQIGPMRALHPFAVARAAGQARSIRDHRPRARSVRPLKRRGRQLASRSCWPRRRSDGRGPVGAVERRGKPRTPASHIAKPILRLDSARPGRLSKMLQPRHAAPL